MRLFNNKISINQLYNYEFITMQMDSKKSSRVKHGYETIKSLSSLGTTLLVFQICIILLYAIFVRFNTTPITDTLSNQRINCLISTNVMIILGLGFFMSFMQNYTVSPLVFVLLVVSMSYQLYVLLYGLWQRIFLGFSGFGISINLDDLLMIRAGRCAMACVISLAAVGGRIGPKEIMKIVPVVVLGYTLNQAVVQIKIQAFDAGGSMLIHAYGSIAALTISFILAKKIMPYSTPAQDYRTAVLSLLGTLFLWICWPVFNYALYASNAFERQLIITNTVLALSGSCLAALVMAGCFKQGLTFMLLHQATVAGGVAIGASAQMIYQPAFALALGVAAGVTAALSLRYLQGRFQMSWGLLDTYGILSLSALPSILGGFASAMILLGYFHSGFDQSIATASNPKGIFGGTTAFNNKGGYQAGALVMSIGMGAVAGMIAGSIVAVNYRQQPEKFYCDDWYFDANLFDQEEEQIVYNTIGVERYRYNAPSEERFQGNDLHERTGEQLKKPKPKFKTRYGV